jgi:hypothetical protein
MLFRLLIGTAFSPVVSEGNICRGAAWKGLPSVVTHLLNMLGGNKNFIAWKIVTAGEYTVEAANGRSHGG